MIHKIQWQQDGTIAVLVIENPPVNAISIAVRRELLEMIERVRTDPNVDAAVLMGRGSTFVAGADLREMELPLEAPHLLDVIVAIENCGKPVVAALHGAVLGGGLEVALGCDARLASFGTRLGLPEVTLGIIPGAGGTQRLPRLVGLPSAIHLACSGERIGCGQALAIGLIDKEVNGDLRMAAVEYARRLRGVKSRLRDQLVPQCDSVVLTAAFEAAMKSGKGRPAVQVAIDCVMAAACLPFDEGLAQERAAFKGLRVSREARALRHQFFAEREAVKHPELRQVPARTIQYVVIVGAGTMGSGIALAALDAGFDVALFDQDEIALQRAGSRIHDHYAGRIKAGKLQAEVTAERKSRLHLSTDWAIVSKADLVIEAVFELLSIKQEVFRKIDVYARPGAVLATNTSYLDVDAIARTTSRPREVIGLHFFSPANLMRLLEVVRGDDTAPDVVATGLAFSKRLNKLAVLTSNAFGFIGNRIYSAYRRQCEFMLEEGANPEQVDAALEAFGFAMGPFAVSDMSGLDIAWRMRQAQSHTRDSNTRYVDIADRLCEAGRLGRKTGAGYYAYDDGSRHGRTDPEVTQMILAASKAKDIVRREFDDTEIQRRAILAMVNEAALLLGEGVAQRPSDVDVVLVNGYGFPRWEGGAIFWSRERGKEALASDLDWLAEVSGAGFERGEIHHLWNDDSYHLHAVAPPALIP